MPATPDVPRMRDWRLALMTLLLAWLAGCAALPGNVARPASTALASADGTALGRLTTARQTSASTRQDSGFGLLDTADLAYASRLALIERAEKTLDLQYYTIHADPSTRALMRALRAAAARGVRVRILLDDFNSVERDALVLRIAFLPNVQVRLFNPLPGSRHSSLVRIVSSLHDFARIQHRMHNKLFIADNAFGITGGRNLGDAYFGQAVNSNFADMDVLATGRVVHDMSDSFDRYWSSPLAYPVESLISREEIQTLRASTQTGGGPADDRSATAQAATPAQPDLPAALDLTTFPLAWAPSALLADQPAKLAPETPDDDIQGGVVDGLLGLMQMAQREVLIVSPYFVPGERMMAVFAGLRERGVRLRVLTNSLASTDATLAHVGYARHRRRLLELGVELHELHPRQPQVGRGAFGSSGRASLASLHAKVIVIDGRLVGIGSMNLDLRSQRQNSEVALLIRSRPLGRAIAQTIEPTLRTGAWRLRLTPEGSHLWQAPPGADFGDSSGEPDASVGLQLLLHLIAPFAPDEML